jgi:hypothetical protein
MMARVPAPDDRVRLVETGAVGVVTNVRVIGVGRPRRVLTVRTPAGVAIVPGHLVEIAA